MNSSPDADRALLPQHSALQHERAPRPLPLFLELVRQVSSRDPLLGAEALAGLRAYGRVPRRERPPRKPEIASVGGACLRDHGGEGKPAILVPSLIHERAPRPLPLFLELVRQVSSRDPLLGAEALAGLRAYGRVPRRERPPRKPEIASVGGACLRDHGGEGKPAILVPSLINPPRILDLDQEVSLASAIAAMGRRSLLLDWGTADRRSNLSVAGHVEELLLPLLRNIDGQPALIGYCLGGTMAIAAANLASVECVVTLAAPWNFDCYPENSHHALQDMWSHSKSAAEGLGALPMEVLQAAFWSLDPERTVRKFAEFGRLDPASAEARRFIELEEWANEGEPLPYPAAKELVEELFGKDRPGSGTWEIGGRPVTDELAVPALHLTAERDLIAPPQTAGSGEVVAIPTGHVGMIVGSARTRLCRELERFLGDTP